MVTVFSEAFLLVRARFPQEGVTVNYRRLVLFFALNFPPTSNLSFFLVGIGGTN